jgi:hypothetical protein
LHQGLLLLFIAYLFIPHRPDLGLIGTGQTVDQGHYSQIIEDKAGKKGKKKNE